MPACFCRLESNPAPLTHAHLSNLTNLSVLHFMDDNMEQIPVDLLSANRKLEELKIINQDCPVTLTRVVFAMAYRTRY